MSSKRLLVSCPNGHKGHVVTGSALEDEFVAGKGGRSTASPKLSAEECPECVRNHNLTHPTGPKKTSEWYHQINRDEP